MHRTRTFAALSVAVALVAACGSAPSSSATTTQPVVTTQPTTTLPTTTLPTTTVPTTVPTTALPTTALPTTTGPEQQQLSIWPAVGVVFTTPDAAAKDFLLHVFGDGPMVGAFQAGDSRSGEFEVFASVDGKPLTNVRSILLMRQLGPSNGWFVLAALSEFATITTPESAAAVPAAPLTVKGKARGFEANIGARAFLAGHADHQFDQQSTQAGNYETPLPYEMSLDLSTAAHGDIVVVLVHGGVGLETDPGDFSAIPVVIA